MRTVQYLQTLLVYKPLSLTTLRANLANSEKVGDIP